MEVEEGGVTITVPGLATDGIEDGVFYNPRQERNRDVTIATLKAYNDTSDTSLRYLDAMAASGIRGVRAAHNGLQVTCSDRDPAAIELCRQNAQKNNLDIEVVRADANVLCHERRFDVVDLDPFGSPIPFADAAIRSASKLLCVTATDTAPLCGAHFRAGIRRYGAIPRRTEYHPEMGLRVLLSALVRTAAKYDIAAKPLLSHVESHSVRTYLQLESGAQAADAQLDHVGTLWHCPECLHRESQYGFLTERKTSCPACGSHELLTAGPLWLAEPHDSEFVTKTARTIDQTMGTARSAKTMLERIAEELPEPTHYDQHYLCKRWGRSAGSMDRFLEALRDGGFQASRSHYGGTTFKTNASVPEIRRLTAG